MTAYQRNALAQGEKKFQDAAQNYDAMLVVSFGGPEGMDDVMPFMENVLRGRPVPRERMIEVSQHYRMFGGVSPLNAQNRALISALEEEFATNGLDLPIYFGNRNWHPLLPDTLQQMREDGVKNILCFFTSMFSSYSGCRQYRENLYDAVQEVGEFHIDKIRMGYNHPLFVEANAERLKDALAQFEPDEPVHVAFSAHSIPLSMAQNSDYEVQLRETAALVADMVGIEDWDLVYQSRSGAPHVPWLEPDILDHMQDLKQQGKNNVVIHPIGFISDHMEVIYDLDTEAKDLAAQEDMKMVRAQTVGTHHKFVTMIREMVVERMAENPERRAVGSRGPNHDVCPVGCCMPR